MAVKTAQVQETALQLSREALDNSVDTSIPMDLRGILVVVPMIRIATCHPSSVSVMCQIHRTTATIRAMIRLEASFSS